MRKIDWGGAGQIPEALGQDRCGSSLPINRVFFCFFRRVVVTTQVSKRTAQLGSETYLNSGRKRRQRRARNQPSGVEGVARVAAAHWDGPIWRPDDLYV